MNNAMTAQVDELTKDNACNVETGQWSVKGTSEAQTRPVLFRKCLQPLGLALVFALSPITALADPWLSERRRFSHPTARISIEVMHRRRLSLSQARRLALELLASREDARLMTAEREARRAFEIEENP